MTRRSFLGTSLLWTLPRALPAPTPFPVRFRSTSPFESLYAYVDPGYDEFAVEKAAAEITAALDGLIKTRSLPLAPGFHGPSPMPVRYRPVAPEVAEAEFDINDHRFQG